MYELRSKSQNSIRNKCSTIGGGKTSLLISCTAHWTGSEKSKNHKIITVLGVIVLGSMLQGCKIVQTVGEGGSIVSDSGRYDCAENQTCEIDIPNGQPFTETFTAVAFDGYEFVGWRSTESYLCVGNDHSCVVDIPSFLTRYDATGHITAEFVETSATEPAITTIVQQNPLPEEPHYTIIQEEGQIQYWLANDTEPAQALHIGPDRGRTRIYDNDEGAIDIIVNEDTGEFLKVVYKSSARTDVYMFNSVGEYISGYGIYEWQNQFYIGDFAGSSDFINYRTNGRLVMGDERRPVGTFDLYTYSDGDLENVRLLPEEFAEFVRELEGAIGEPVSSVSGFGELSSGSNVSREQLVDGLAALVGAIVATKTGQGLSFFLGGASNMTNMLYSAVSAKMRGQDVTKAVVEGVIQSLSVCNVFGRVLVAKKMCEAGIDLLAGRLKGEDIGRYMADIVLKNIHPTVPLAVTGANLITEEIDYAKHNIFSGQEPAPSLGDDDHVGSALPNLARAIRLIGNIIINETTSSDPDTVAEYELEGDIQPDGSYRISGCPNGNIVCRDDDILTMHGTIVREADGTLSRSGQWIPPRIWPPEPKTRGVDYQPLQNFDISVASSPADIEICVRDHQCEDGDRVQVSINGIPIMSRELFNAWYCETVTLDEGTHIITLLALNGTGYKGSCSYANANTGEIRVSGTNSQTQSWQHVGGEGSTVNLVITVE